MNKWQIMSAVRVKTDVHRQDDDEPGVGTQAEEATGQIPVHRARKEVLPPDEQGSSDAHEPFGAEDDERKEKR